MSLAVWLPLNGDLHNQGLSNIQSLNNGATIDTNGKIGKCYNVNNSMGVVVNNSITLGTTFSIACWIKINSYNQDWANAFKIYKDGYDYIGLCMNQANATTKQLGFHIYKNNGSNARTGVTDNYYIPLTVGKWYHLCFIVIPTQVLTYQNGVKIKTNNITTNFPSITNYNLSLGKSPLFYGLDCSINDFRLYDHALSAKEVEEIAKGLVLHYPLNNNGFGNKNYFKNSHFSNGTTSWYGISSSKITTAVKDGRTCITGTKGTNNNIIGQTAGPYTANTTIDITISANIYVEEAGSFALGNWISSTEVSGWQGLSGTRIWNKTNSFKPGWNRLDCTLKNATNQYNGNIVTGFAYTGTTFWMADPKIEFSSVATPWCPHVDDAEYTAMKVNDSIEHDISGYGNDGIITGTLETTTPNPRYNCTIQFDGSSYILTPSGSFNWYDFSQGTFSVWIKPTATASGWSGTVGIAGDNSQNWKAFGISFYVNEFRPVYCNTNYTNISTGKSLPVGEWHFCCATIDGTTVKSYFDGELVKTTTIDWKTATIPTNLQFQVGVDRPGTDEKFTGQYSDIRFYTTILTDSQIAQLYKDSMVVDSSRNIAPRDLE